MKFIKIYRNSCEETIVLTDEDDSELREYSNNLSSLLSSGNVVILETSSGNFISKPSKIDSIFVSDKQEVSAQEDSEENKKVGNKYDPDEDVVREEE